MSLGYFLTEQVRFAADGQLITLGTWDYKPPAVHDIPLQLNVKFVASMPNPSPAAVLGRYRFSKVCSILNLLCKITVVLTFQKICLDAQPCRRARLSQKS